LVIVVGIGFLLATVDPDYSIHCRLDRPGIQSPQKQATEAGDRRCGVKITELEILKVPPSWVWVRVHTDEGLTGLGEPYLENHPDSVIAEVKRLEPLLLGKDPRRVEELWRLMYEGGSGYKGGPVKMSAISGIDIALWDIAGKAAGVPIYQMLGGACRERVRMYRAVGGALPWCVEPGQPYDIGRPKNLSVWSHDPKVWAEAARVLVQEWGFRCLKAHIGVGDGPGVDVAIDVHNPHPAIARQLVAALAPHRPLFVEEPMPVERVDALEQVARDALAPIAAGERWMGKWVFFDALSRGLLAVVQPDICHAGGITECRKIAAIAEAAFAKVALHCPLSPIALAASIQLDACLPNFLVQEHNEVNDWREGGKTYFGMGYLKEPFVLGEDGCVRVPAGAGLGIELDEEGMRAIMARPWRVPRRSAPTSGEVTVRGHQPSRPPQGRSRDPDGGKASARLIGPKRVQWSQPSVVIRRAGTDVATVNLDESAGSSARAGELTRS
jgi:galactonate dehydratase